MALSHHPRRRNAHPYPAVQVFRFFRKRKPKAEARPPAAAGASMPSATPTTLATLATPAAPVALPALDMQDTTTSYDRVFNRVMATVEGVSSEEAAEILAMVKRSGSDGLNMAGYFEQVFAHYFRGRDWTWTEYDQWAVIFAELGEFPSHWTDIDQPAKARTQTEELLRQRGADLRAFLDAQRIEYSPDATKAQLVAVIEHSGRLERADSLLRQAVLAMREADAQAALERRPRLLYDLLMRTIAYRAKSERDVARARAAGVKRFDVMLASEADRKFVEVARKHSPSAVPPFYPNDFTLLRPVIDSSEGGGR